MQRDSSTPLRSVRNDIWVEEGGWVPASARTREGHLGQRREWVPACARTRKGEGVGSTEGEDGFPAATGIIGGRC